MATETINVIRRDPFSRCDIVRETIKNTKGQTCDWCGQVREVRIIQKGMDNGITAKRLYRYGIDTDNLYNSLSWFKGVFCSYSCCKDYHS